MLPTPVLKLPTLSKPRLGVPVRRLSCKPGPACAAASGSARVTGDALGAATGDAAGAATDDAGLAGPSGRLGTRTAAKVESGTAVGGGGAVGPAAMTPAPMTAMPAMPAMRYERTDTTMPNPLSEEYFSN